jgi:pimeloyl-ACP methyl ester carboxylesterase
MIYFPPRFRPDKTYRPLLGFHGRSGTYATPGTFEVPDLYLELAQEHEVVVVTGDWGGPTNWGNPTTAVAAVAGALTLLDDLGVDTTTIDLYAGSMGALTALNWARENASQVRSVSLVSPATNLAYFHDTYGGGTYTSEINTAYGDSSAYTAALPTSNPIQYAESDLDGLVSPIKVWYSEGDEVVRPVDSIDFATAAGADIQALSGDPSHANALAPNSEVISFLLSN